MEMCCVRQKVRRHWVNTRLLLKKNSVYNLFPAAMVEKIIDTHVHIWDLQRAEYEWLKNDTSILNRSYNLEELTPQIAKANVTHGILVQAANNFEDTDWMLENAERNDWIIGVVGWLPLTDPAATEKALQEKYLSNPYFKGVRHLIHNEADPQWLLQDTVIESLKILAKHQLTYDIVGINADHLQTTLSVVEKVPELKMVFDHLNQPPVASQEKFGLWGELMKEASKHENFYCKISGLGTTTGNFLDWTKEDIIPYVLYVLELFGTGRCFCGGDWPVSLLAGPYEKAWLAYQQILCDQLTNEDQQKVFWQNAETFYKLNNKYPNI
jgi:L-fuconolactonase